MEKIIIFAGIVIMLILLAVVLLSPPVRRLGRSIKNDESPVLTEYARLTKKVKKQMLLRKMGSLTPIGWSLKLTVKK